MSAWMENSPGQTGRRPVMTTRHATADFVVKAGYFILAAAAVIFVSMLFLTFH
jgi:hypothetical protein